ncbi:MAG: MBL fold metallo-hydrolase [Synergistales bacterium]|nr:MBL fold metallo-hydrolase [Synergistales bacterium]
MRLRVLGAAGEVTGSNYLIETGETRVLIDCGLHQGKKEEERNREPFPFAPGSVTAVVLTHAHLDHTGRVPQLVKQGFAGRVWGTSPTVELSEVLWEDAAHLMKEEAQWRSRKNRRKGLPPVEPLYDAEDARQALEYMQPVSYDDVIEVAPGVRVRFRDAGHILGSANLEVWVADGGEEVKVVFSGDLGPRKTVMEREPSMIEDADYVVIESTYGDREHKTNEESREEFREVMREALRSQSKVLIPTFVVDRAQRVLYEIMLLQREGILRDNVPIYFDSPMGVKATEIYRKYQNLLSREIQGQIREGHDPFEPRQLHFVSGADESRAINQVDHAIVLAGSGMCNGGRIIHHLKHNLWDPNTHVVFVGYQARGTLGRRLVGGEQEVRVAGEEISVRATLHTINGFSAHADRRDLLAWARNFRSGPQFLVTHGEPASSRAFAEALQEAGFRAAIPEPGQEFQLTREPARQPAAVVPAGLERSRAERNAEELVADIADLATLLKGREGHIPEEMLPLLESSRTLLSLARERCGCEERGGGAAESGR